MVEQEFKPAVHCIVHTPLAYLCACEYLAHAGARERYLCVIATSRASAEQIRELASRDEWTRIFFLREGRGPGTLEKILSLARLVKARMRFGALLARIPAGDRVILSHLNNPYSRFVLQRRHESGGKVVIVDDGTTTLEEYGTLARSGRLRADDGRPRHSGIHARLEAQLFSSRDICSAEVAFFSFWPLQTGDRPHAPEILQQNSFPVLKAGLRPQDSLPCVYFVGQPFVRRELVNEKEYGDIVRRIAEQYRQQGLDFIYHPHRNEDPRLIAGFCEVRRNLKPFELELLEVGSLPRIVAGFYSACILTSLYLFGERMKYELFWGFDRVSPERGASPLIAEAIEAEAQHSPVLTIDRSLGLGSTLC